jgi:hypothetical protein
MAETEYGEIGTTLDPLTQQRYGVKGMEPDTTFEFIGSYPTEPISPFDRYLLALENLQDPMVLSLPEETVLAQPNPIDLRRPMRPTIFGPVTPSGYAEPSVDPMSYYERPTTMATGGGGGFENLGGGFNRPSTSVGSTSPSTTPSGGLSTAPTTGSGTIYRPGEYDPATGIGVVYSPGPDEQPVSQPSTKPSTSPWGTAVVPGGGAGTGGGGRRFVTNPNSPVYGYEYGSPAPNQPGTKIGDYVENNLGQVYDWETDTWSPPKIVDTPLVGPRFETDPVNVTIPVETQQPAVTTPPTKTQPATPPAETKQPVVSVGVTKPTQRPPAVVQQRPPFQFVEPTLTRPPLTGPSITDRPIRVIPFPELPTVPTDTRRAPEALLRSFRDINYDPEEILAAAMRSMGGRMARRSILNELS